MKISQEIIKLKEKLTKIVNDIEDDGSGAYGYDNHFEWLSISFEYESIKKEWHAAPIYESGGDGHPLYINFLSHNEETGVLQGLGKTIISSIKDLWKEIEKYENKDEKKIEAGILVIISDKSSVKIFNDKPVSIRFNVKPNSSIIKTEIYKFRNMFEKYKNSLFEFNFLYIEPKTKYHWYVFSKLE